MVYQTTFTSHKTSSNLGEFLLFQMKWPLIMASYFINEDDEIRSIEDDRYYFHYFIDKNTRLNDCQRYAFNGEL